VTISSWSLGRSRRRREGKKSFVLLYWYVLLDPTSAALSVRKSTAPSKRGMQPRRKDRDSGAGHGRREPLKNKPPLRAAAFDPGAPDLCFSSLPVAKPGQPQPARVRCMDIDACALLSPQASKQLAI
jgi:hypothetical protein